MTTVVVNYPTADARLANAVIYPDTTSYPGTTAINVESRYDSDNRTNVPGVSTAYIYPKTTLLTQNTDAHLINGNIFGDNSSLDGFGRLRVSDVTTLLDSKLNINKAPWVYEEVVNGSASSTYIQNDSCIIMQTGLSGDYVIRQTRVKFNYQPGKSLLGCFSGIITPETNITKRIGLFHSLSSVPYTPCDGIYFESSNNTISVVILKTLGVTNTESVAQSGWNIDRFDGTGPSRITLDFNYAQVFVIEYEWLGVGRVRTGFVINGRIYYNHAFIHLNSLTVPYMTKPNQPVRLEIRQTGAGSGTMKQFAATVMVEGGEDNVGSAITTETSAGVTGIDATYRPVLATRINPIYYDTILKVLDFNVFNVGNANIQYKLIIDPVITGGNLSWVQAGTSGLSPVQQAQGSSSLGLSGGFSIYSDYTGNGQGGSGLESSNDILANFGRLGTKLNGDPIIAVIAARALAGTAEVWASFNLMIKG